MLRNHWFNKLWPLIILVLSIVVRIPYFIEYPLFRIDELYENIWTKFILDGENYPLTNTALFIGALYNYLALIPYSLLYTSWAPRLLVLTTGSLTPPLLYFFVLKLTRDKLLALTSSLVMVSTSPHILIASRVAWSASLTPFLLLLSYHLLYMGYTNRSIKQLFLAGITIGLTIQSHPSAIASYVALPCMLIYYYGLKKTILLLRKINYKILIIGFTLGYINMIIYNTIIDPLGSIKFMFQARWTGVSTGLTPAEYMRRIVFLVMEFITMYPSGIPLVTLPYHLRQPYFYVYLVVASSLVLYGLIRDRRARATLVYLIITILVLAIGTSGRMTTNIFGFAWGPHYLIPLTPYASILLAISLTRLYREKLKLRRRIIKYVFTTFLIFTIMAWPMLNMFGIIAYMDQHNYTNKVFLEPINWLKNNYRETPIFILYSNNTRDHILTMFHHIGLLENLDIYPRITYRGLMELRSLMRNNVDKEKLSNYLRDWIKSSYREYYLEVMDKGLGILIISGNTTLNDTLLKHLRLKPIAEEAVVVDHKVLYKIVFVKTSLQ